MLHATITILHHFLIELICIHTSDCAHQYNFGKIIILTVTVYWREDEPKFFIIRV